MACTVKSCLCVIPAKLTSQQANPITIIAQRDVAVIVTYCQRQLYIYCRDLTIIALFVKSYSS